MKVLIIMGGFFPGKKYGGPPVSVDNFCSLMSNDECYILTCDHDLGESQRYDGILEGWNDRGNCKVMYVSDIEYNKSTFERVISELHPNVVYLQGLFQSCVLPCLRIAKKNNIPILLAPRGELCNGALNIKKWKKLPYIKLIRALGLIKSVHWQSTSDEETEAIMHLMKVDDNHVHRLSNIPSIPRKEYQRRQKVVNEGRFVFLSRIHPKKNLLFAISLFKEIKGKAEFDIYGPIEDEDYWNRCQEEIKNLPEKVKVEYKGLVDHDQVHEVFSQYDAFLFPTLSENYGHVIAESLIVGTPVIISDQTPWRGLKEAGAGWDLSLNDKKDYCEAINTIVAMDENAAKAQNKKIDCYIRTKMRVDELFNKYHDSLLKVSNR